ncbi:unnamed protein product, partial [Allacma fusca]
KTNGFVGFGLTDDGRLADLIIGGIIDDELPYFTDRYSSTGDAAEDIAITDRETNILWIIGQTDDIDDLVIGGVNGENLTPYFADRFGTTRQQGGSYYRYIDADASQDYSLISAREENGITRLRFIRDFDTGDTLDYVIKYENAYFIWAIGASDSLSQHSTSDRGAFPVNPLVARSDS